MKNLLLIKDPNQLWLDLSFEMLEVNQWRPALWIPSLSNEINESVVREGAQIYHLESAVRAQRPEFLPPGPLTPLDGPTVEALSKHQDIVFRMIERFSVRFDQTAYDNLRNYYWRLAQIWLTVVDYLKIDIVVCPTVPHRIFDYVVYVLFKEVLKKPYLMLVTGGEVLGDRKARRIVALPTSDLSFRTKYLEGASPRQKISKTVMQSVESYLEQAKEDTESATPQYFQAKGKRHVGMELSVIPFVKFSGSALKDVFRLKIFSNSGKLDFSGNTESVRNGVPIYANNLVYRWEHLKKRLRVKRACNFYSSVAEGPTKDKKYILFAPNMEPERTTNPDAGFFGDLELILSVLEASLPDGWEILYKEHFGNFRLPIRPDNVRSEFFYKRILRSHPSVRFAPFTLNARALIDNAEVVATTAGTPGWEARIRGKPVLVFGAGWYGNCDGVFRIQSLSECQVVLENIRRNRTSLKEEGPSEFLYSYLSQALDIMHFFKNVESAKQEKINNPKKYWDSIKEIVRAYRRLCAET
jgi:hypothetical protein